MVSAVQLPLASSPTPPVPLDPALFRPGITLEALVLGKTAEGLTQLQIGDLLVLAKLPQSPPPGTMLQLSVKSGGPVPELVVVTPQPAAGASSPVQASVRPLPVPPSPPSLSVPALPSATSVGAPPVQPVSPPSPSQSALVSSAVVSSAAPAGPAQGASAPTVASPAPFVPATPQTGAPLASAPVATSPPAAAGITQTGPVTATPTAPALPTASPSIVSASLAAKPVPISTSSPAPAPFPTAQILSPAPAGARPQPAQPTTVLQAPPQPSTPQAALAQMVPAALGQQGSPAPLLQMLSAVVASAVPMPAPVLRAAQQILANRVPVAGLSGEVLKAAVERSGVAMEAILRAGALPPPSDAKAGLLALRSALVAMLGDMAPVDPVRRVPPPIKGEILRAQMPAPATDLPSPLHEVGRALHGHTEAALSRLKLMQLASLPDADGLRQGPPEVRLEIPLMVGAELAMMQLQIFRDRKQSREESRRGWIMRFAVATEATGEVGAEVGLIDKAVTVSIWAAEEETSEALNETLPELAESLASHGLRSSLHLRSRPPTGPAKAPGTFVDRGT